MKQYIDMKPMILRILKELPENDRNCILAIMDSMNSTIDCNDRIIEIYETILRNHGIKG